MLLHYYRNAKGERVYTMKKFDPEGNQTKSAHPARFSPEDRYSCQRVMIKKRFGLLPTQRDRPTY